MIGRDDLSRLAPRLAAYALVTAIAVMAGDRLVGEVIDGLEADPGRLAWLALLVPLAAGVAALARWAPAGRVSLPLVGSLLALHVGLRWAAAVMVPAPLATDWLRYHELAVEIVATGPRLDVVPTGFPMLLAAAYAVAGPERATGQALQVVLGLGVGIVAYALAATAWNHRVAAIGLLLLAVAPSQVLIGTVLSSEPLYTLLFLLAALAVIKRPTVAMAVVAGLLLGMSQYVRSTSLALVPVFAALAWRWGSATPRWRPPAAMVATFLAVLVPVLAWNLAEIGAVSVSTSRVQNYSILVGLNQDSDGRFNADDLERVGGAFGTPESEAVARRLVVERVRADPLGTAGLVLRKAWAWGDEDYGSYWAIGVADDRSVASAVTVLLSQAWWAVVAAMAAVAVAFTPIANRLTQLTIAGVATIGLLHLVLEAQGRYHSALVPLVAILAAAAVGSRLQVPRRGGAG